MISSSAGPFSDWGSKARIFISKCKVQFCGFFNTYWNYDFEHDWRHKTEPKCWKWLQIPFPLAGGTAASFTADSLRSQKSPERADSFGHHGKEDLSEHVTSGRRLVSASYFHIPRSWCQRRGAPSWSLGWCLCRVLTLLLWWWFAGKGQPCSAAGPLLPWLEDRQTNQQKR